MPPERLVNSELFEPRREGLIVTVTLEERDGKTEVGAAIALDLMEQVAQSLDR